MSKKEYPEVIVGAFIKNRSGELLFVSSRKWKNIWNIPGGHVERGESFVEALKREVLEEVGLKIDFIKFIGIQQAINPKGFHKKAHFIFFDYLCECDKNNVKIDKLEIQDYKWVKIKDAKKLKTDKYTRHSLSLLSPNGSIKSKIPAELERKILDR